VPTYSRARRALLQAEYNLAVGEGDARQRLRRTYRHLRSLQAAGLPPQLRSEWQTVLREMTRFGPEFDRYGLVRNALEHTMSRIRNRTARKIAERIYRIHAHLSHTPAGRAQSSRGGGGGGM
jgi:hypothetical protein